MNNGLAKELSNIEQQLIQIKGQNETRGDSFLQYSLYLNLGAPTTNYVQRYLTTIVVEPKKGRWDNLIIMPIFSPGRNGARIDMGGVSWEQYDTVGKLYLYPNDVTKMLVLQETTQPNDASSRWSIKDLELTIYSNYELYVKVNEKTSI